MIEGLVCGAEATRPVRMRFAAADAAYGEYEPGDFGFDQDVF